MDLPLRARLLGSFVGLSTQRPAAGLSLLPLETLTTQNDELAARTRIRVLPTPHAKPGGPEKMTSAMVLEAAAPIINDSQKAAHRNIEASAEDVQRI